MKKRVLAFLLTVVMCLALAAPGFAAPISGTCGENVMWYFDERSGTLTISGTGPMTPPDPFLSLHNLPWYDQLEAITRIVINYGVTEIYDSAFRGCTSLTSVTIPNSVTSIDYYAFYGCTGLTSVTIPNSVTSIDYYTFYGCTSLTSVSIPNSVTIIEGGAFRGCTGLTGVAIPGSVTSIEPFAFYGCTGLTGVTIPSSVTSIGDSAFASCTGLTAIQVDAGNRSYSTIDGVLFTAAEDKLVAYPAGKQGRYTIPSSVTSIGDSAFYGCTNLTSVSIPTSVTSIGDSAFTGCTGLKDVYYAGTEAQWKAIEVGLNNNLLPSTTIHYNSTALVSDSSFVIENGLLTKYIGKDNNVVIPSGVTGIGSSAFRGCTGLTSVSIPNSVTGIGNDAFRGCTGLTSVAIPNSVTSIGNNAFHGCTGLTGVAIPSSVTSIGFNAFYDCTGLTEVDIPNSVTSIGNCAFYGCTGLTEVDIPSSVASIGGSAFYGCTGLTEVDIPSSVTSIGEGVFRDCTDLTAILVDEGNQNYSAVDGVLFTSAQAKLVAYPAGKRGTYTIPNSVTGIEEDAFRGCTGLTGVAIPNSVTSIANDAFHGCTGLTGVAIPGSVTSIGDWAFYGCTGLTGLVIPSSVTEIGHGAFFDCGSLKDVYYTGTDSQWNAVRIEDLNAPLTFANIHYNSTTLTRPSLPTVEDIPDTGTAVARPQTVKLDGKDVQFQYYAVKDANGNESNYVKIRDLALALNGTKAQFNVGWDGRISITSNTAYQITGGEGTTPYSGSQTYNAVSIVPVNFNGNSVNLTSFSITYQGGGYTYYKLRDLGQLLNFNVKWDDSAKSVVIESDKPFTGI